MVQYLQAMMMLQETIVGLYGKPLHEVTIFHLLFSCLLALLATINLVLYQVWYQWYDTSKKLVWYKKP